MQTEVDEKLCAGCGDCVSREAMQSMNKWRMWASGQPMFVWEMTLERCVSVRVLVLWLFCGTAAVDRGACIRHLNGPLSPYADDHVYWFLVILLLFTYLLTCDPSLRQRRMSIYTLEEEYFLQVWSFYELMGWTYRRTTPLCNTAPRGRAV